MQLKSLKIFCDIVGRRSFSRAAEENGLSQSGASQVVHQLEEELGVKLIDRSKRPFVLTPEGETYYEGCRKLIDGYGALEEQVRTRHAQVAGRVRVASIHSVGLQLMSRSVEDFRHLYPSADVRLEYRHPRQVYEAVERDEADVGLVSYPKPSRTVTALDWRKEPMVLVCAPGNRFAERAEVALEELDGADMVAFTGDLTIRREIDRALHRHHTTVKVALEFDSIEHIKRAIEIDEGVALLPEPHIARERAAGTLVAVPLAGDGLTRPLGIIHRRGKDLNGTAGRFVDFLLQDTRSATVLTNGENADNGNGSRGAAGADSTPAQAAKTPSA